MKSALHRFFFIVFSFFIYAVLYSQEADTLQQKISLQYVDKAGAQAANLSNKLDKKSERVLAKFQKQEAKMRAKLMKIDSSAAKELFQNAAAKYKGLEEKLKGGTAGQYIPKLDTLITSLKFLQNNPELLAKGKEAAAKLKAAMTSVDGLKDKFQQAEAIKQFIKERKQYLKDQLSKFGFSKELKKLNKEVYYYAQQVNEYKETLKDSKKAEKKAIELLSKTKLFKDFMRKNSMLAGLFPMPAGSANTANQAGFAGLQTRMQLSSFLQQAVTSDPNALARLQQNIGAVQNQTGKFENILSGLIPAGKGEVTMPDFKPNSQKTKSFAKRLEFGSNFQSQKARLYFPVTTDMGLSVGYKLNDKSIIGLGASYKIGWGENWQKIKLTSQGVGIRSFIDWKIKGSFWLTGGYEQNYRNVFNSVIQLSQLSAWQQSGLIGMSKNVSLKTKFFKKMKLQLLWDFLSYRQIPITQPVLFRVGYNF